jgi:hypothetical protein
VSVPIDVGVSLGVEGSERVMTLFRSTPPASPTPSFCGQGEVAGAFETGVEGFWV